MDLCNTQIREIEPGDRPFSGTQERTPGALHEGSEDRLGLPDIKRDTPAAEQHHEAEFSECPAGCGGCAREKEKLPAIGPLRWHDLRHTFGSIKIEQGENIYYVQRQMGRGSIQVTIDIYGHQLESRRPEAAAKTDELVFGK